jgi:perosamine synthetase
MGIEPRDAGKGVPKGVAQVLACVGRALHGHAPPLTLHEPEFAGREQEYAADCIATGWVSSVGAYVDRFERDLATATGARHVVATSSGTAALHICMLLAGVGPGDEVLVPALTFVATANAIAYTGATPYFIDSEPGSLGVDAERLEAHLAANAELRGETSFNRRTGAPIRALVVLHVFGHVADLDALAEVARRWRLELIEDAAEALGSRYHGQHAGTFGRIAALSFNGNKIVTTGGGGAILTNDAELGRRAKHLTTTARVPDRWNFVHDEVGYNYRLPNLNAALGCAQLEQLDGFVTRKRALARRYQEAFGGFDGARFLVEPPDSQSNYWLNAIVLDQPDTARRDDVLAALNGAGYMSRPVWRLMHKLPMYATCPRMDLPVAEALEASVINLPSSAKLGG